MATTAAAHDRRRDPAGGRASGTCGCTSAAWAPIDDAEIPIIVRGEGCYLWDEHGNRYFDGLSALFCSNIGHGRAGGRPGRRRPGRRARVRHELVLRASPGDQLAARIADLAPGDLNRVFFTSGGSEAVESALKLSRQFHKLNGNPLKTKVIARDTAYHGTSLGALSATGITVAARRRSSR